MRLLRHQNQNVTYPYNIIHVSKEVDTCLLYMLPFRQKKIYVIQKFLQHNVQMHYFGSILIILLVTSIDGTNVAGNIASMKKCYYISSPFR